MNIKTTLSAIAALFIVLSVNGSLSAQGVWVQLGDKHVDGKYKVQSSRFKVQS